MMMRGSKVSVIICVAVFSVTPFDLRAQTIINTLNEPAQTPADGINLTVTGTGSIVTASPQAITGAGNNTITIEAGTVAGGGTVQGASTGVDIDNATGTVDNSGTVTGTSARGVQLSSGGMVTNRSGALISGGRIGVLGESTIASVTVINDGQIDGNLGDGVSLQGGGSVANTGTISTTTSTSASVRIQNGTAATNTVTNSGMLQAPTTGFNSAVQFNSVGGSVDNQSGGSISGAGGVSIGGAGDVMNAGSITGVGSTAVSMTGGGMVTNSATGTISSSGSAISITGAMGTVNNAGTISSAGSFGVTMSAGGSVTNSKTISSAVSVSGGTAATNRIENQAGATITGGLLTGATLSSGGDIINGGSITGGSGVNIGGTGGTLTNTGTVGATGFFSTAATVASGSTIDNSGSITADDGSAVSIGGGGSTTMLTNQSGGQIIGGTNDFVDAVSVGSDFSIVNNGLIRGRGSNAFFDVTAIFGSSVTGSLTNNAAATIENQASGVAVDFTGSTEQSFENAGTINGDVRFGGGADTLVLKPGSAINGTLNAGDGADSLELNATAGTSETLNFDSTPIEGLNGEVAKKTGTGSWTLAGTAASFSPIFDVEAGTLIANANTPGLGLTVQSGATVSGTGTLGGVSVAGTVSPGNSIGTMTVSGDSQFDAGSTYEAEVANDGTSDLMSVSGSTTLNGGTVSVTPTDSDDSYSEGQRYTIITSTGGVTGQFAGVTDLSAFLDFALSYDPNNVYLTLSKVADFASVAQTFNQFEVSKGLQDLDISTGSDGNAVAEAILGLDDVSARAAYDRIQGEIYADAQIIGADAASIFTSGLLNRSGGSPSPFSLGNTVSAYADDRVESAHSHGERGVWGALYGATTTVDSDGNAGAWTADTGGIAAGLEFEAEGSRPLLAGLAIGYSNVSGKVSSRGQSLTMDSFQIGAYGRAGAARGETGFSLAGAMAYAYQSYETQRSVVFSGVNRTASATFHGHALAATVEARHGQPLPIGSDPTATLLSPFLRIEARMVSQSSFSETGAGSLNLSSSGDRFAQGSIIAGLAIDSVHQISGNTVRPSLSIALERIFGQSMPETDLILAGSPTAFSVRGPEENRNRLRLDTTTAVEFNSHASLDFSLSAVISEDRSSFAGGADFRVQF